MQRQGGLPPRLPHDSAHLAAWVLLLERHRLMASGTGCGRSSIHYGDELSVLRGVMTSENDVLTRDVDNYPSGADYSEPPWEQKRRYESAKGDSGKERERRQQHRASLLHVSVLRSYRSGYSG